MGTNTFTLKEDRFAHPKGTTVYRATMHDYGLASDDGRITGVEHVSVSLTPDGKWPLFTVPVHQLAPVAAPADNDFPLGKACDLSGEGNCEACQ